MLFNPRPSTAQPSRLFRKPMRNMVGMVAVVVLGWAVGGPAGAQTAREEVRLNWQGDDGRVFGLVSPQITPDPLIKPSARGGLELKITPVPDFPSPVVNAEDLPEPTADVWTHLRKGFALNNLNNSRVFEHERFLRKNTRMVNLMLVRSRPYLYFIAEECFKRGLPTELALIPFVESQFNPNARSPAAAEGLWQFIPSTGRNFDLKQNRYVDERRDIRASTRAALDYLTYLYDMHKDWHLALASYNWGEGSVLRAVKRARDRGLEPTYENLDMPAETRNYVPKLQALKNLLMTPEDFNVTLPDVPYSPYFTEISHPTNLDLRELARLADIDLDSIKKLNSGLNQPVLYASQGATLLVPVYHEGKLRETLQSYQFDGGRAASLGATDGFGVSQSTRRAPKVVKVRKGDTLTEIAQRYGVDLDDLKAMNKLGRGTLLKPGSTLRLPGGTESVQTGTRSASRSGAKAKSATKGVARQTRPKGKARR